MNKLILVFALISLLLINACSDENNLIAPVKNPVQGNVNLTRLVTIGNSITSGYQSGSLFQSAQNYSFGNLIAMQVGASYQQPLVADPGTKGRMEIISLSPLVIKYNTNSGSPVNTNYSLPYNNLGIPGAVVYDILNATNSNTCASGKAGVPNPMFDLVLRGAGTQFQQAKALNPTYITLWIGNNDVLGYATSGGVSPSAPTPSAVFAALYSQLADSIASLGVKVAVANIPEVTAIPFFNTVGPQLAVSFPWTAKNVHNVYYQKHGESVGTGTADSLSLLKGTVLLTLKAASYTSDFGLPSGRFYRENNYPAIPSGVDTTKPFGLHPQNPIPDALILDENEMITAKNSTRDFNSAISQIALAKQFILVDMNTEFNKLRANDFTGGTLIDGIKFKTSFITGGLFSLDGVHPTNQGQGFIANLFIKAINSAYNATIPVINLSTLPGSIILAKKMNKYGLPEFSPGTFDNIKY